MVDTTWTLFLTKACVLAAVIGTGWVVVGEGKAVDERACFIKSGAAALLVVEVEGQQFVQESQVLFGHLLFQKPAHGSMVYRVDDPIRKKLSGDHLRVGAQNCCQLVLQGARLPSDGN